MMDIKKVLEELSCLQEDLVKPSPVFTSKEEYEPYVTRRKAIRERINELRQMVDLYDCSLRTEPDPGSRSPEMVPLRVAAERTGLSYNYLRTGCIKGKIVHIVLGSGTSYRKKYLVNMDKLNEYLNRGDSCCCEGR